MKKNIFPKYTISHLKDSININVNGVKSSLKVVSLDNLIIESYEKINYDNLLNINVTLFDKTFDFEAAYVDHQLIKESKIYSYELKPYFRNRYNFLRWLAVIKGIHRTKTGY